MLFRKRKHNLGFNLRTEFIDEVLEYKPKVSYLEVIIDNWFTDGPHHQKLLKLREDYEILFHCVGMNLAGVDEINKPYLQKIQDLKLKFQPKHISDHLCFQAFNGNYHHDLLPFALNKESFARVSSRVNKVQDMLKEKILVENLSYYLEFKNSNYSESFFLNELCETTGCKVLLDLNNILVNFYNLDIVPEQYVNEIDVVNIGQLHFSGAIKEDGFYIDTHSEDISKDQIDLYNILRKKLSSFVPLIYERDANFISIKNHLKNIKVLEKL